MSRKTKEMKQMKENLFQEFDVEVHRRGSCSYKWDSTADGNVLPMWVADMDFRTAPAIVEALKKRVEHGIFGYTRVPEAYYDAVTDWFGQQHGWSFSKDWVIYTSGVVSAISAVIKALTRPGDGVIVQTPVYNCFFSSIRNNGCRIVENPLLRKEDTWVMDYGDLEEKTASPDVKLLLLCNPHNPVGRVWTRDELQRLGTICLRNGVTVVADEIHCELVYSPHVYTPFASICDEFQRASVVCVSPSKAFNIAGLQIANIVTPDENVRRKIDRAINDNEVCDVNPFGVCATIAAYREGGEWLSRLKEYLHANYLAMKDYCNASLKDFPLSRLEGTYLVWMDCSRLGMASDSLEERLKSEAGLWLNSGTMYGAEGEGFMRWNIACPRHVLMDGLERFRAFVTRQGVAW